MSLAGATGLGSAEDMSSSDTAGAAEYVPLEIVGRIQEKVLAVKASAPELRVTSFPVARHRSDGPQLKPGATEVYEQPAVIDGGVEEIGVEGLAKYAQPLQRREKLRSYFRKSRVASDLGGEEGAASKTKVLENSAGGTQDGAPSSMPSSGSEAGLGSGGSRDILASSEIELGAALPDPVEQAFRDTIAHSGAREKKGISTRRVSDLPEERVLNRKSDTHLQIDSENRTAVLSMTASEVETAQAELKTRLRPEILEMLRKRGESKEKKMREAKELGVHELEASHSTDERSEGTGASRVVDTVATQIDDDKDVGGESSESHTQSLSGSWTSRVEAVRLMKFDLEGRVVSTEDDDSANLDAIRKLKGDALKVAERDLLRSEGDPAAFGYSILEATALARSTVPGQRTVAIRLLASVLNRAVDGLQCEDVSKCRVSQESVDWQAIWAYALGPEPEIALTLRLAMDDTHTTVVSVCAKALQALLSCSANESFFDVQESFWPGDRPLYTAPVFRRQTKQDEGFIGGGRWKYNVKATEMLVEIKTDGESQTVGDDATVASKDVAAGLIRMGILPRIRFILEVEKNVAAEEALLDVVISLARHSPAGAVAVLNCPRLMDTIIQQFLASDENMVIGIRPVHTKAIRLLKVLSQTSLANCVRFAQSGALQVAQTELFHQAYLLPTRSRVSQEYLRGLCTTLVEALRLWRVCIAYGIGIFLFPDFYPALCFWLAPFAEEELSSKKNSEAFCLTQESFSLLERLARTLVTMHPNGEATEIDENCMHTNWSWAVAVPLVKTALEWLSADSLSALVAHLLKQGVQSDKHSSGEFLIHGRSKNLIGSLAAVLHFLSTICDRILPLEDGNAFQTASISRSSPAPWLPNFVPEIGLAIVNGNLLTFVDVDASEQTLKAGRSLAQVLLGMRLESDYETSAAATNCIHGIVRLVTVVDNLIRHAKAQVSSPHSVAGSQSRAHVVLGTGLVACGKDDLRHLLAYFGNEVILNQEVVHSIDLSSRGGPAPGVGLGWGCVGGGTWSKQYLSAKMTASLVLDLLRLTDLRLGGNQLEVRLLNQVFENTQGRILSQSQFRHDEQNWRFQVGMGIAAVAGPGEGDIVKSVLSTVLLDATAFATISENVLLALKLWRNLKNIDGDAGQTDVSLELDVSDISKSLLNHFSDTWLAEKSGKNRIASSKHAQSKKGTASQLARIDEDTSTSTEEFKSKLGREWSGQRLPLPAHWFLSPLATDIGHVREQTNSDHDETNNLENGSTLAETTLQLQKVVIAGLFFLLGVEGMTEKVSPSSIAGVSHASLGRKVHALSTVFVLGGDTFLSRSARDLIRTLQEMYGQQLDGSLLGHKKSFNSVLSVKPPANQGLLDFNDIDAGYVQFAESLAQAFSADSYGDIVFARQVSIYLRRDIPDSIRIAVWQILAEAQILHLLPPFEQNCSHQAAYLYPPERNEKILDAYHSAWTAGLLDKAAALGSMSFFLVLHHVAEYVFGVDANTSEGIEMKKKAAKSLLRSAARKPKQLSMLQQLVSYNAVDTTERWLFLSEAAAGDKILLAQLASLKNPHSR